MKLAIRSITTGMSVVIAGLLGLSTANAATSIDTIGDFNVARSLPLKTKSTSWNDPAFGNMGWTHNSGWGKVWAKAGQIVTIKAVASNPNLHPAISVWYRGIKDTAPDKYVHDHFYVQNANQFELGATDEANGALLGNIVMNIVRFGFDKDLNKLTFLGSGIKDGVSGQLILKFTAKTTGTYMFVVGGFTAPHASVDSALSYTVQTTVTRATPTTTAP
jgi:hypothetical protein